MTYKCVRKCPLCDWVGPIPYSHFKKAHPESKLTKAEFVAKVLGLDAVPKCANPNCNNPVTLLSGYRFSTYCSQSCKAKVILPDVTRANWKNPEYRNKMSKIASETAKKTMSWLKYDPEFIKKRDATSGQTMTRLWQDQKFRDKVWESSHNIMTKLWEDETFRKHRSESSSKTLSRIMHDLWDNSPEFREKMREVSSKNGHNNRLNQGQSQRSGIELTIYQAIKSLFPDKQVISNQRIGGYFPDILIVEDRLIIEVDGAFIHNDNLDYDLNRDKYLYSLGYKVRRLDSNYCNYLSDDDLTELVKLELSQTIPYYERINKEDIFHWKCDIWFTESNRGNL